MYSNATYFNGEQYTLYCTINGTSFSDSNIYSLEFEEGRSSGSSISFGEACSKYVKLKILDTGISLVGATITLKFKVKGDVSTAVCPLGTFYVSEIERKDGIATITAYDKMALLNVEYVPNTSLVKFPATCYVIMQDISTQYNFSWKRTNYLPSQALITNVKCTVREMLGYIAGLNGGNARFNRDNAFEIVLYDKFKDSKGNYNFYNIDMTSNTIFERTKEDSIYEIDALVSGEGENEIKSGDGKAITFANPFMTQERLDLIRKNRLPYDYYAGTVKFRANPCYEVGDCIRIYEDDTNYYYLPIMTQSFTFDGGLTATVTSYGMSDNTAIISDFKSDTVTLERNVSKIESMQETIIGSNGGCYELLLDESDNNRPYGTAWWKDTSKTAGWKFTYGGLGYFNNNVLQKTAITNDGSVLADNITANSILTNSFTIGKSSSDYAMSFDGSTGKITFGSGVSMSWADITDAPTIPSKTSDLSNDSGYVTSDGVPTKTSELDNDSGYITDGDIPTKTSDLTNDSDFINSIKATTITNNAISTASISANQITTGTLSADRVGAGSFYITGGYINIDSGVDDTNTIRLVGSSRYTEMGPGGLYTAFNDGTYRAFVDAQTGFYVGDGNGNSGGLTTEVLSLSGISLYNQYGHFMFSNTVEPEGSFNWDLGSDSYYWDNVYCYSVNQISDRNFKEDITPLATKYIDLFDKLNPVSFKFKGGNRTHTGFIAQDIETAMNEVGLTSSEFAGFYKSADDVCGLRYTEFISLLTAKIQQLEDRIEVLENGQTTND